MRPGGTRFMSYRSSPRSILTNCGPLSPQLVSNVAARDTGFQTNVLSTLGHITEAYPDAAEPAIEALAGLTESTDSQVRANALGLLADVAKANPSDVAGHLDNIEPLLTDDDEFVRGNAASAVIHIAVEEPDAADGAIPALIEGLDDPSSVVRSSSCKALGHLGATVAMEQLRARAESDSDAQVRKNAKWALEQVA